MADSDEEERCIGAQTQPRRPPRDWKRVAIIFGLFGFVMHFRPAEPFMTPYLIDDKGLTEAEVRHLSKGNIDGRSDTPILSSRLTIRYTPCGRTLTLCFSRLSARRPSTLGTSWS